MTEVFMAPIDFNKDTNMKFTIFVLLYAIKKAKDLSLTFSIFCWCYRLLDKTFEDIPCSINSLLVFIP